GLGAGAADHDLVVGARHPHGISIADWTATRLMRIQRGILYVRTITGLPLRDCTGGFQVIRRAALERIGVGHIRTNGYSFLVELKYRIFRSGGSMVEVPIVFTQRRHGRTKMTRREIFLSLVNVWKLRLGLYRR